MGFAEVHSQWRKTALYGSEDRKRYQEALSGGFSYNNRGESPHSGYMVGLHKDHGGDERVHHVNDFTPQHIADHREALPDDPGVYQGAWKDGDHVYLDHSRNVLDHDEAVKLGREHKQKAIWDVRGDRELRLDTPEGE